MTVDELLALEARMTPEELEEWHALLAADPRKWFPNPGPQLSAYTSQADIIGYGGAAGGGKTDLVCGLSLTEHIRILIARRQKTQTQGVVQRLEEILGSTDGYSSQHSQWRVDGRLIEFAGMDNDGDERKFQGRPHDLIAIDEATEHREAQVRFLAGWCRTNTPGQRCRTLLTFNPPTTAEGRWVIRFFGPWLDKKHPNPAADGELRYFTTVGDNADFEVPSPQPFVVVNGQLEYDFNPRDHAPEDIITPKSRTFITARVTDNPFYMATGYIQQLQQLPEPLRSQMLKGDFEAGVEDDANQLIPTAWIEASMDRWIARRAKADFKLPPMDSIGVDAARGGNMGSTTGATGKDKMVIFRRHGTYVDTAIAVKGVDVNDGSKAASVILNYRTDLAPVHIDVIGIGTSPYDFLNLNNIQTIAINGAAASKGFDKSGLLSFPNLRSELYWAMREALDPANPDRIDLPDDSELLADLAAPTYQLLARGLTVESKPDIVKRIKRSPDKGDAAVYSLVNTPKRQYAVTGYLGMAGASQDYEAARMRELER